MTVARRYLELVVTFVIEAIFLDPSGPTGMATTLAHAVLVNVVTLPLKYVSELSLRRHSNQFR